MISPVEEALFSAMDAEDVVVLAIDKAGQITMHTTIDYPPDILWTLENAKKTTLYMSQPRGDA